MDSLAAAGGGAAGEPPQVLYDSGRFSLWVGIPGMVFGLVCLYVAAALVAHPLFGINLGFPHKEEPPLRGALYCSLCSFAIGAWWIFIWLARLRVLCLYDPQRREVIRYARGYFRTREEHISLSDAKSIWFYDSGGGFRGGTPAGIALILADGSSRRMTQIPVRLERLSAIAAALGAAAQLPIRPRD